MIYLAPPPAEGLTQGDVLDACPVVRLAADGQVDRAVARVIVLTQACDVAQQKARRVVVASVHDAAGYVAAGEVKPTAVRDQVRLGKMYGLYFLPEAPAPMALPESIVDLRNLYTIPRVILDDLVASGKRLCRLATPYREHLAQHFAVTYMRIALPTPYETLP